MDADALGVVTAPKFAGRVLSVLVAVFDGDIVLVLDEEER